MKGRGNATRGGAKACWLVAALILFLLPRLPGLALTLTVSNTVAGKTPQYIGGNEGAAFRASDLQDSGMNLYRVWATMGELEYYDDDWVSAGYPGWPTYPTSTYYGTPTIAQIKADPGVIPWSVWSNAFARARWTGAVSFKDVLAGCRAAGVEPLLVLRPRGPGEEWITWIPGAPDGEAFWAEWWEYCFAVAHWCNVSNNWGITHFEVHNEPDLSAQGWTGTASQYVQLVTSAHDALAFANSAAGLPVYLHAPQVSDYGSSYLSYSLDHADTNIDVVDYHVYDKYHSLTASIASVKGTVLSHNPDGVAEPVWISEWGDLDGQYDTVARGLLTAQHLCQMAQGGITGAAIFMCYDWGAAQSGLISTNFVPYDSYYAFRLVLQGLGGGRDILEAGSSDPSKQVIVTRNATGVWVLAVAVGTNVDVDLSQAGYHWATAETREYSATHKDVPTGTLRLTNGVLSLDCSTQQVIGAFLSADQLDTDDDGMHDSWELLFFPSLTNADSASDYDQDEFPDLHEFLAGTSPTDSSSLLRISGVAHPDPAAFIICWPSASSRVYGVQGCADLAGGFADLTNGLSATWPENSFTDAVDALPARFYRIQLEP
ncbi:hypothetical protein JXA88_14335 [Candidatus Fermentibacteria bacterium]|nr:hypothetical protein [Candidatus Fermentibacteria bacterium]